MTLSYRFLYIFLSTCLLFTLASCNDDNFDMSQEEVVDTLPDTVSTIAVTGKVVDRDGNLLADAELTLLHNGIMHTTSSQADGTYAFIGLPAVDDRLEALAQNYNYIANTAILHVTDADLEHDFVLLKPTEVSGGSSVVATILSDSLVSVSGRVATDDGALLAGAIVLIAREDLTDLQYAVSDENGIWEIATAQRGEFALYVVDVCRQVVQDAELVTIATDDVDVGTVSAGNNNYTQYTFTGRVLDCDTGLEVQNVAITIAFEGGTDFYRDDNGQGAYNIEGNNCGNATCYTIRALTPIGYRDTTITCLPFDGDLNYDIYVCKETLVEDGSEGTFTIDGTVLEFDFASATSENSGWQIGLADPDLDELVLIFTPTETGSGDCFVAVFENTGTSTYLTRSEDLPNYTIDSISNNFVYGTMTGTMVEAATATVVNVSATYKAKIQ